MLQPTLSYGCSLVGYHNMVATIHGIDVFVLISNVGPPVILASCTNRSLS